MADRKQFIIEGIAKIDNVMEGIKKIQGGLSNLKMPDTTQRQFENLYKKAADYTDKAKKALSSGFETKGAVKDYTTALKGISDVYSEILDKTKGLKIDKDFLNVNFDSLDKANKELDRLKDNLDAAKVAAKNVKTSTQKVFNGVATFYSDTKKYKNPFKEWREAADALKRDDIPGVQAALDALEQKFQGKNTTSGPWAKRYDALVKLQNALASYQTAQSDVTSADQDVARQQQVVNNELDNAAKSLDPLVELMEKATKESEKFADSEGKAARGSQELNSELEHFKNKAAYFFGISNAINLFKRALRSAYDTVKDLDAVMTETAVVTNFDVGDMWERLPEYTQRANELGVTIHDTYEAATLFYQQGLRTNEVMQISNETLKMARIAGLDAATASDRMTNALRGFNMELDKTSAQRVNDVYSKLAAITASNTDEISTAMTKVASLAHNANMEFETTAAFLAQIIESTRESAETAGTALKTVVARFSEVKKLYSKGELLGTDEEGEEIDVNKVSTALRSAGINLNEYLTGAKGLDDIFIELAEKWDSLDQVQQRYIATMAAGSRQQSRFIALMSDYKRTMELVEAANNANGASQEQYEKTLESLQTKLARLKNAWNEFILGLTNSDVIKGAVDLLTNLITAINELIKAVSNKNAGVKMITSFFTAFTAFKIGQKAIGKNSGLMSFFARFVGENVPIAQAGARDIVKGFYSTLSTDIADAGSLKGYLSASKDKGLEKIFSPLGRLRDYWGAEDVKQNILAASGLTKGTQEYANVAAALDQEKLKIGELNQVLADNKSQLQINEQNQRQFGIAVAKNDAQVNQLNSTMRVAASVTLMAGTALMIWGDNLEKEGNESGKIIKGLGVALTTFGTIMSVYLPLQAQLGAKGVTSAIASIPIVGWVALAISAIAALIAIFAKLGKENSAEGQLKKASEAAKAAAEAADEARDAYEKLNDSFANLDSKYEAIENATKGTREWRDAIRETNEAVLELLSTYDSLEVERDENGILKITKESQNALTDKLRNDTLNAEAYERFTKIDELEKLQESRYAEINNWTGSVYKDVIDQLQKEGKLGSATPDEIKQALSDSFTAQGYYQYNPEDYVDEVMEYGKLYAQNQAAISAQNSAFASSVLDKAQIDKDLEKYADTILTDEYINTLRQSQKDAVIADDLNLRENYAKARGYDDYEQYQKDNPDEKVKATEMQDYVASVWALDEAAEKAQLFANNIYSLGENEKALFAQEGGKALTREQLDYFLDKGYDREQLFTELGGKDVFGSFEQFDEFFSNILIGAIDNFDTTSYNEKFNNIIKEGLTSGLTSGASKAFTDNLWSVYVASGEEGVKAIQDSISKITEEMDDKDARKFVEAINNVNWESADSVKTLDELANEFGISEEVIKAFENQIIELNNAMAQFDAEKLATALGLVNKISSGEQGRSFSKEAYETAVANGADPSKFAYNINTDTYDYIGKDVQDVRTAILQQTDILRGELEKAAGSNEAVGKLLEQEGGEPGYNNESELKQFLFKYIWKAGDNSLIDEEALRIANLEQTQAMYNKVMQEYYARENTQANLDQANAYRYQANTGSQNVDALRFSNDENARNALIQQVINSGLPEELVGALIERISTVPDLALPDTGYANNDTVMAGNIVDTLNKGAEFGIEPETLNEYVASLQQIDGLEKGHLDTLYALALANERYQQGFKNVIESYDTWIELKREDGSIAPPDDGNLEQMKAYGQLKKDLKEMFNLAEDIPDEFLKSAENVELLEAAVDGSTDAVNQLRTNLLKTQLKLPVDIDPESRNEIYAAIDQMSQEATTLEFGATLDSAPFAQGLLQLLMDAGVACDDINKMFESIGWTPPIEYEEVPVNEISQYEVDGQVEVVDPATGATKTVPTRSAWEYNDSGMIRVPKIGNAQFTPPEIPSFTPPSTSSGGGGGGKTEKPSYWENPYDELYNLQEKINEALRTREALERRYQKLLKEEKATLSDIRKAYYSQINNLRAEADLQKQFAAGRLRQIQNIGEQMYTDSEGDRSSFNSWGVTKYASYDANTGLIQIDWNGLEEIANDSDREEEGKAAEAYISKLEELTSSYEEVRDKLWEIEDEIENLREAAIESYLSFEDRVLEALVNSYQQQIDSYQAMNDSLEKASNEVLTSLREQVELSRQIRDNTDKEKQIADMENRLAYLQRDTSGSNALEIQKLQKDLEDARESYTDTLVDQAIEKMQNEADLAAEQRARQIETMQEQLEIMKDTGALWQQVYDLMDEAAEGNGALSPKTTLVELLKDTEAFTSLSNIGQAKWWSEVAEEFHAAWVGRDEAEDKYKTDANNDGIIANSGTSAAISSVSATADSVSPTSSSSSSSSGPSDADEVGVAMNICGPNNGWGNGETRRNRLEEKGFDYWSVQSIVNDIVNSGWDDSYYRRKYGISDLSDYSYYAFKTGGLADFTGPAWLDGTKAKPELILNAQDSANFIALKDILASLLNVQGGALNGTKNGDNYFDIDISANIGSDYDVDRLAERLKQNIYNDGQYRNVNTINFLR